MSWPLAFVIIVALICAMVLGVALLEYKKYKK